MAKLTASNRISPHSVEVGKRDCPICKATTLSSLLVGIVVTSTSRAIKAEAEALKFSTYGHLFFFDYKQKGYTYLVVLFAVAIMGATLALTGTVWHTELRREKEAELLYVGGEFRRAIKLYFQAGGQYPKKLEDLLKDPRQPATVRYLRKIYLDPITGKNDWGVVLGPNNGIIAVYSLSKDLPLKTTGFALADKDFESKTQYSEWQFVALPAH